MRFSPFAVGLTKWLCHQLLTGLSWLQDPVWYVWYEIWLVDRYRQVRRRTRLLTQSATDSEYNNEPELTVETVWTTLLELLLIKNGNLQRQRGLGCGLAPQRLRYHTLLWGRCYHFQLAFCCAYFVSREDDLHLLQPTFGKVTQEYPDFGH